MRISSDYVGDVMADLAWFPFYFYIGYILVVGCNPYTDLDIF